LLPKLFSYPKDRGQWGKDEQTRESEGASERCKAKALRTPKEAQKHECLRGMFTESIISQS